MALLDGKDCGDDGAHFVPWSMRHGETDCRGAPRSEDISCIVCFETQGTADVDWHACRTCSAAWCDRCMAQMHDAARDHEEDVDLTCPQCRGSISDMQLQGRLRRITAADGLGCTEEQACDVVYYENLLAELVHLCECDESGLPYFTMPVATVARVMARDEICEIVDEKQGTAAGSRLRRMMRAADYPSAFALVLQGFAAVLRASSSVPRASGLPSVEEMVTPLEMLGMLVADLSAMVRGGGERLVRLVLDATQVLEAERAAQCTAGTTGAKVRKQRGQRGRRPQRDSHQTAQAPQAHATAGGVRKASRHHLL